MDKKKFFVNVGTQEISQIREGNNDVFTIYATPEEVIKLRQVFDEALDADNRSFIRSHIPFIPYHQDKENDQYDKALSHAYAMIHDLGDDQTREHIDTLGMIGHHEGEM